MCELVGGLRLSLFAGVTLTECRRSLVEHGCRLSAVGRTHLQVLMDCTQRQTGGERQTGLDPEEPLSTARVADPVLLTGGGSL